MRAIRFAKALLREIGDDDIDGLAAEMTYRILLALAPLLLLVVTVLSFLATTLPVGDAASELLGRASPFLPPAVEEILRDAVRSLLEHRSSAFLTIGLLGTVWGASAVVSSLIKALDRAYGIRERAPLTRRLGLAIATPILFPALAGLIVAAAAALPGVLRLPVTAGLALGILLLVYWGLPSRRRPWREALPGSLFTAAGLVALSRAFAFFAESSATQGALFGFGAAFVLLVWLHLASLVLLVGAEINAQLTPR